MNPDSMCKGWGGGKPVPAANGARDIATKGTPAMDYKLCGRGGWRRVSNDACFLTGAALCLCLLKNNDTFKNDHDVQQNERTKLRKELNLENRI